MTLVANGRKEILAWCEKRIGITSWQSVRFWRRCHKLPIRYYPTGRPYLIIHEAERFLFIYSEKHKKEL